MLKCHSLLRGFVLSACMLLVCVTAGFAATKAQKCEAAKLKIAGKYGFCRLNAEAKAVKTGDPVDLSKCEEKYGLKWPTAEVNGDGQCPTSGDQTAIHDQVLQDGDLIVSKLAGLRFVDNGDGTITDTSTNLMWEKKANLDGFTNSSDPHDADNSYTWCANLDLDLSCDSGSVPNGDLFFSFLYELNGGVSDNGSVTTGCFAGHCDWRIPTVEELFTLVDLTQGACNGGALTDPCIDPIFGTTVTAAHWTMSTINGNPVMVWQVLFQNEISHIYGTNKAYFGFARAVRAGTD